MRVAPEDGVVAPSAFCAACGRAVPDFAPGPRERPRARCPRCQALERHRFLALLLAAVRDDIPTTGLVVEVAPTRIVTRMMRSLWPGPHLALDFDPAADGRDVDVQASLTHLPLGDASASFLLCYHVLEHIPDDASAIAEIARVLAADGLALVQVPWHDGPTDEDPGAGPEERVRRFGQADHVRFYGVELVDRLAEPGLRVLEVSPGGLLDPELVTLLGLVPDERAWFLARTDAALPASDSLERGVRVALAEVLVRSLAAAQESAARSEKVIVQLRAQGAAPPTAPGLGRRLRRAAGRVRRSLS